MKKEKKRRNVLVLILLLLIVTVGYSMLSRNLNIRGTSKINNSTWDVHFEDITVTEGSIHATTPPHADAADKKTTINYSIDLEKPGDFYEFDVKVVNKGSVDAKLKTAPTLSGLSEEQDVYTNYTFTHADETNSTILAGEEIKSGESKKYRIRVEYDRNVNKNQLPSAEQNLNLTASMDFEQA